VCSFSRPVLAEVSRLRGAVERHFCSAARSVITVARTIGPRQDIVTRGLVGQRTRSGCASCRTVNDVRQMVEFMALGVDGLVTDEPALAREVARSRFAAVA
jgi:glycerophosphoryl diester phosphodiesterase